MGTSWAEDTVEHSPQNQLSMAHMDSETEAIITEPAWVCAMSSAYIMVQFLGVHDRMLNKLIIIKICLFLLLSTK